MKGNDYHFILSQAGRQYASERWQLNQYAGACPVSLDDYYQATKTQAAQVSVDRESLRQCFSDLIVTDMMLDQLGPALISQNSIFVYGPTGNGKTSLAERMLEAKWSQTSVRRRERATALMDLSERPPGMLRLP